MTAAAAGARAAFFARAAVFCSPKRGLRRRSNRRHSFFSASGNATNTSAGECELVECEANFGDDDDASAIKACVARINGKEINASAMRNLTLLNSSGEMQKLPLTGDKDVVVYLRHLG